MITKRQILTKLPQVTPFSLSDQQKALLTPIGDIHWGSEGFPFRTFRESIKIAVDRGSYFLGMGDYLEFTSDSQRDMIDKLRSSVKKTLDDGVRAEADRLLEVLAPTRGRWVGMLRGNHTWLFEDRTSVEQYMCNALETDYLGDSSFIRLKMEDTPTNHPEAEVVVFAHHGKGGGQTIGGQLNNPEKALKFMDADLVLMGHSHAKITGGLDRLLLTPDGVLSSRTVMAARTGAFLRAYAGIKPQPLTSISANSEGSYVEKGLFMPSCMGCITFSLGYEQISKSKFYRPVIHHSI